MFYWFYVKHKKHKYRPGTYLHFDSEPTLTKGGAMMRNIFLLFSMPFFMIMISACLSLSSELEEWSSANLFNKLETTIANAKTETQEIHQLFEVSFSGKRTITEKTLHTFSVTDWGNFTYEEKKRFIQTAFPIFEVSEKSNSKNLETLVNLMDARYKKFLTKESGLPEHTDLSELSLLTEVEIVGQQHGLLAAADDH